MSVTKMRSRILDICNNHARANMPEANKRDKEFKDKVDVLFGYGGTKLLREDFLDRHKYKRPQTNYESEENAPANEKTEGRPENEISEGRD